MKVKVEFLFSNNKKIGSKIISWGTKHFLPEGSDVPSHVAILVNGRWVHESTLETGVRVISYDKWLEINHQVARIPNSFDVDYDDLKTMFRELRDKKYDWAGVTYFGYRLFLNKFLKRPIPEKNKWQNVDRYFCCEVMGELTKINYEMTCPAQILKQLTS